MGTGMRKLGNLRAYTSTCRAHTMLVAIVFYDDYRCHLYWRISEAGSYPEGPCDGG